MGCGAYIDAEHGQQPEKSLLQSREGGQGGGDVTAGAERKGEGMGCGAYIDAAHGQQPGCSLQGPREDDRGGGDVSAGAERV